MRLRILLEPHHGATYAQILALATAAEEAGFPVLARGGDPLEPPRGAAA